MTTRGRVREWHGTEGWGVLDSEATPGGCWAHFSAVLVPGPRTLDPGQDVDFTFVTAEQDGFAFRAVEVWPSDREPVRDAVFESGPSSGFGSTVAFTRHADRPDGS